MYINLTSFFPMKSWMSLKLSTASVFYNLFFSSTWWIDNVWAVVPSFMLKFTLMAPIILFVAHVGNLDRRILVKILYVFDNNIIPR